MPNLYKKFNFKSSIIKNAILILLATITLMIVGMIVKAIGVTSQSSVLNLISLPEAQADAPGCASDGVCGPECCGGSCEACGSDCF